MLPLRKMVVAIIWYAKIKTVKLTFVGYALVLGNHMDLAGIIVIVMTKKKPKQRELLKINQGLPCNAICFIAIGI